jgi:hypothetical protein
MPLTLRELRLWHWRMARVKRMEATLQSEYHRNITVAGQLNREADFHIKAVQLLNNNFPEIGDTAERDDHA